MSRELVSRGGKSKPRCRRCGAEMVPSEVTLSLPEGVMVGIPGFVCQECGNETLGMEQAHRAERLAETLGLLGAPKLVLKRKVTGARGRVTLNIPKDIAETLGLETGTNVRLFIDRQGRLVVESTAET